MEKHRVTVIMGVYNCEETLEESLNSLLNQTYQNFKIVICDDKSTDNTLKISESFCSKYPDKFLLLRNEENKGLNYTLNKCLQHAEGDYIARMDGDDISLSKRFEKQVSFLNEHTEFSIVSSQMTYFDEKGDWGTSNPKEQPQPKDLIKGVPFAHAPCMIRNEAYKAVDGYSVSKRLIRVEDYHLWMKMYSIGLRGYNIQEPLYKMRDDQKAAKRRNIRNRINESYVKYLVVKNLKLPFRYNFFIIRPILVGLIPRKLYIILHQAKLARNL